MAELLTAAGVDFGILFDAERNSGNDVWRVGEEGLLQSLAQPNIDAIQACTFNRIMTTDPHSLNALRNDYQSMGASLEIMHHTAWLAELVRMGKLDIAPAGGDRSPITTPAISGDTMAVRRAAGSDPRRRL